MRPHLYKRPCPSVRPSVGRSVGPLVRNAFVKIAEKRILNDLDSAGRGKKRDEEKRGSRGRWDEESEKMKKLLKK